MISPEQSGPMLHGVIDKSPDTVATVAEDPSSNVIAGDGNGNIYLPGTYPRAADPQHEGERGEDVDPEVDNDHQREDVDGVVALGLGVPHLFNPHCPSYQPDQLKQNIH